MAIRRDVYVGESPDEARRSMAPYLERGYRGFPQEALLIGSAAEVAEKMAGFGEMGFTDVIVRNISADQRRALSCIERLAEVQRELAK